MKALILASDLAALASAALAAWLWFQASGRRLRRISYREVIDAGDLNRMVTAPNRSQILNARAALATAASALFVAVRFVLGLLDG